MQKTDGLRKFFNGRYSENVINQIKKFYFNECNTENETTRFENICHVRFYVLMYKHNYFIFYTFSIILYFMVVHDCTISLILFFCFLIVF